MSAPAGWDLTAARERASQAQLDITGIPATLNPRSGGSVSIVGIIKQPAIEEELLAGGFSGVNIVRFWVRFEVIDPNPRIGDTVVINSIVYDVADIDVNTWGNAVLKLKRNA